MCGIKWLRRITVSDKPSDSHYHYFDNRVLPPQIDYESGIREGYFKSPDTILYEININSVIHKPSFGETIIISDFKSMYQLNGYAYSGGGRKINRVELTLDKGKTWIECRVEYPECSVRHGSKYWTWCHWELELKLKHFLHAEEKYPA